MTTGHLVNVDTRGGVGHVTLRRPNEANAIDLALALDVLSTEVGDTKG